MKKRLLIPIVLTITLLSSGFLQAQDTHMFAVRAGWQNSGIFIDGDELGDPHQAFYAGLYRDDRIVPMLFWGKGIEYMQAGFRIDDDNRSVFHYISVPLYLKFKVGPVFALGGVAGNFRVGQTNWTNGEKSKASGDDQINFFDIPAHVGLGVTFFRVTVEARYHWGLIPLDTEPDIMKQYFQLGAAVNF